MAYDQTACIDVWGACVKLAILDALGENPDHAAQARWWLDEAGMSHLLQRPEAQQFTAEARKRPKRGRKQQPVAAATAQGV